MEDGFQLQNILLFLFHFKQTAEAEYQKLMAANQDLGIRNVGHCALRWLQAENGIPTYGIDFDRNNTPEEVAIVSHPVYLQKVH